MGLKGLKALYKRYTGRECSRAFHLLMLRTAVQSSEWMDTSNITAIIIIITIINLYINDVTAAQ